MNFGKTLRAGALCVGLVALTVVLSLLVQSIAAQSNEGVVALASRPKWKTLPPEYLAALGDSLKSREMAEDFADLCEKSGVLERTIRPPEGTRDADLMKLATAFALTSLGNAEGEARRLKEAKQAFRFALLLKPDHLPAVGSLALVEAMAGNCRESIRLADRVLAQKVDPKVERAVEKEATAALNQPDLVGVGDTVRDHLRQIKAKCAEILR